MSLWKRNNRYWTDFTVDGRRYRKPLGTSNKQEAVRRERDLIETARNGGISSGERAPKTLFAQSRWRGGRYAWDTLGASSNDSAA